MINSHVHRAAPVGQPFNCGPGRGKPGGNLPTSRNKTCAGRTPSQDRFFNSPPLPVDRCLTASGSLPEAWSPGPYGQWHSLSEPQAPASGNASVRLCTEPDASAYGSVGPCRSLWCLLPAGTVRSDSRRSGWRGIAWTVTPRLRPADRRMVLRIPGRHREFSTDRRCPSFPA